MWKDKNNKRQPQRGLYKSARQSVQRKEVKRLPRARDPNRDKAYNIYKKHNGSIDLVEIASQLSVSPGTVRGWKSKDDWEHKLNGTLQTNTERSNRKKSAVEDTVKEIIDNDSLSDKQRLFCLYYSKSFNATRSYQKAYTCDYITACASGPRLLENVRIKEQITKLKKERYSKALLEPEDIFQKYMDIAFADISDYLDWGQRQVEVMGPFGPIKGEDGETITKTINAVMFKESSEVDGSILSEVKQGKDGASIKLDNRMKALEWLAAHMDMATEIQRLEMAKLKYEVSQLSGGNDGDTGIKKFLKAVKPTEEDIKELFGDEEVIEDAETNKEE